jgi:hypothetical protein
MRLRALIAVVAMTAVCAGAGRAAGEARKPAFKAVLTAATHTPKVNTTWRYSVRVTDLKGHPIWARITPQIVDPLGTKHPVEFDGTGRNPYVKNYRFFGNFCDSAIWPTNSAVGVSLKFQTVITTASGRVVLTYAVTPRQ